MTENRSPVSLDCLDVRARLDDLVDGELPDGLGAEVEAHLVGCDACRGEEARLRALLALAAAAPRELPPAQDLWPGIASRLAVPSARPKLSATPSTVRSATAPRWRPAFLALAALLLMAVGGVVTHLVVEPRLARSAATAPGTSPATDVAFAATRPDPADPLAGVELEVLRAKEALWRSAYRGRAELSPETVEVVERNLRVLDDAIAELRAALVADPGNPRLTGLLVASHRREIALLERLSHPFSEA